MLRWLRRRQGARRLAQADAEALIRDHGASAYREARERERDVILTDGSTLTMQFRIQFLDGSAQVIRELHADARNAASAIELVRDIDWPPRAATMGVLDLDGREVHSKIKGDSRT
jgi:hypothetical protein